MKNDIGGAIKQIPWDALIELVDRALREDVAKLAQRDGVEGIVVFEVLDLGSASIGQKTFMCFGPGCTYKTVPTGHLGDVPSRFAWPVFYWSRS